MMFGWLFGRKEEYLSISKHWLKAFESSLEGRFASLEKRMFVIEGSYGDVIKGLKSEIREYEKENEELQKEVDEAKDIEVKRQQVRELAPKALDQMDMEDQKKAQILAMLADSKNQEELDNLIEQFFPDTKITVGGLVSVIPIVMNLVQLGKGKKPKQESTGDDF